MYENVDVGSRRIRVHTTSEMEEGCSIVASQHLNCPVRIKETDVVYESLWQIMLKRSVIDVDVGPGTSLSLIHI